MSDESPRIQAGSASRNATKVASSTGKQPQIPNSIEGANIVVLDRWEEITGRIVNIEEIDRQLIISLSTGTIVFSVQSPEHDIVQEQLRGKEGCSASILRTDSATEPIRIDLRPRE